MAYSLHDPVSLRPGADGGYPGYLAPNHNALWETVWAPVASVQELVSSTTSVAADRKLRFRLRGDADEQPLRVLARVKVDGGDTVVVTVAVGGAGSTTGSSASAGWAWITIDASTVGATDPATVEVSIHTLAGSTGYLGGIAAWIMPSGAVAAGQYASGFKRLNSYISGSDRPVPSERWTRLLDGPRVLAADRPATLISALDDEDSTRAMLNTTSVYTPVARFLMATTETRRLYRVDAYLRMVGGAGTAYALVRVGDDSIELSGTDGWATGTLSLPGSGSTSAPMGAAGSLSMRRDGAGTRAECLCLQIRREPG